MVKKKIHNNNKLQKQKQKQKHISIIYNKTEITEKITHGRHK